MPSTTKHTGIHMFPSLALIPHQASGGTQTSTPRAAMCRSVQIHPSASIHTHAWYHDGKGYAAVDGSRSARVLRLRKSP